MISILLLVALDGGFGLRPSIDPELWSKTRAGSDAVIIESRTRLEPEALHQYRLIRIQSEQGKAAANQLPVVNELAWLAGRVIDRNGVETTFDLDTDTLEVPLIQTAMGSQTKQLILPPGLTADCLVEVTWREPMKQGFPPETLYTLYRVPEPWPVLERRFEIANEITGLGGSKPDEDRFYIPLKTRVVWSEAPAEVGFEQGMYDGHANLVFRNVPAFREHPFGDPFRDPSMVTVQIFRTLPYRGISLQTFWNDFANDYLKIIYGYHFTHKDDYKRLITGLRELAPNDSAKACRLVFEAFRAKVRRLDLMSPEEIGELPTAALIPLGFDLDMIDRILTRGFATDMNLNVTMLNILLDVGLPFRMGFVPHEGLAEVEPRQMNPFLLNITDPIFLVPASEGKWLTLSASAQELPMGEVPSRFRGQLLTVVDPTEERWEVSFMTLPPRSWKVNRLIRNHTMSLGSDGRLALELAEQGNGSFNAGYRRTYRPLTDKDARDLLADEWRQRLPRWTIEAAGVSDAASMDKRVTRSIRAVRRVDLTDRAWVALDPFPGSEPIYPIPDYYPVDRKQPIVFPEHRGETSKATITLPAGWSLAREVDWSRENALGSVRLVAVQKGNRVEVVRGIILSKRSHEASAVEDLKDFFRWIEEAMSRMIAIRKGVSR